MANAIKAISSEGPVHTFVMDAELGSRAQRSGRDGAGSLGVSV